MGNSDNGKNKLNKLVEEIKKEPNSFSKKNSKSKILDANIEDLFVSAINQCDNDLFKKLIKLEKKNLISGEKAVELLGYAVGHAAKNAKRSSLDNNPYNIIVSMIFEEEFIQPGTLGANNLTELLKKLVEEKNIIGVALMLNNMKNNSYLITTNDASRILYIAAFQNYNDKELKTRKILVKTILNASSSEKIYINIVDKHGIGKRAKTTSVKELIFGSNISSDMSSNIITDISLNDSKNKIKVKI